MNSQPVPSELVFLQDGPFWNMVTSLLVALGGFPSLAGPDNPMGYTDEVMVVEGRVHPEMKLPISAIRTQVLSGRASLKVVSTAIVQMMITQAYENVKDDRQTSPEWEFFRHLRNACAHGNQFNFSNREPIREAHWRSLTIDHQLKGSSNPLFGTECVGTFIATADAILLLHDIESTL